MCVIDHRNISKFSIVIKDVVLLPYFLYLLRERSRGVPL